MQMTLSPEKVTIIQSEKSKGIVRITFVIIFGVKDLDIYIHFDIDWRNCHSLLDYALYSENLESIPTDIAFLPPYKKWNWNPCEYNLSM